MFLILDMSLEQDSSWENRALFLKISYSGQYLTCFSCCGVGLIMGKQDSIEFALCKGDRPVCFPLGTGGGGWGTEPVMLLLGSLCVVVGRSHGTSLCFQALVEYLHHNISTYVHDTQSDDLRQQSEVCMCGSCLVERLFSPTHDAYGKQLLLRFTYSS